MFLPADVEIAAEPMRAAGEGGVRVAALDDVRLGVEALLRDGVARAEHRG